MNLNMKHFKKPETEQELQQYHGRTVIYLLPYQIQKSKFKHLYQQTKDALKNQLKILYNQKFDRVYTKRLKPVGNAPEKMDSKYTPPEYCLRYGITMKGIQNVLNNQSQYYYAYHCIFNKPNTLQILENIVQNGFKIHPNAPNGKIHGAGIYVTPSFSTAKINYSKYSIVQIGNQKFELILQVRVKKESFTKHRNTVAPNDDWPEDTTQWLIQDPSPNNIVVIGILLRNTQLIQQ